MRHSALGLVEVKGYLGAVAAADAALKAASVTCIGVEIIKGGLVTVKLDGDVGAVQAAVEAGAEMAKQLDVLVTRHVIARMHEETAALVAGPVDAGESQRQQVKSETQDREQQKVAVQASVDNSKAEAVKATEAPKSKKPTTAADLQAKAELVSKVVTKEADEIKSVIEQTGAADEMAASAEKLIGTPKNQNNDATPRVKPTHTPTAKSSKKKKKASS